MNYTGERMQPAESDPYTFWEHIYRYAFAARLAPGKRVLDVACGAGYGSAALKAAGAISVLGIDNSTEACAFARSTYGVDARVANAEALPLSDGTFDLVVSFETIEHLTQPLRFLDECRRVLCPGGTLVLSTPNKACYNQITPNNPYHAHELEAAEFHNECRVRFPTIVMYSQRPHHCAWWSLRGPASAFWPVLRLPGVVRARNLLRRQLYPHLSGLGLNSARRDPVATVLTLRSSITTFANPYALRRQSALAAEQPVYLIAVCRAP